MGMIFDIQRMSLGDGPGLRTSVFLKGCPLRCAWCHNPESQLSQPQVFYNAAKCVACGRCAAACVRHMVTDGTHEFARQGCLACGACVQACGMDALSLSGREASVDEILRTVLRDRVFYFSSNGGVTLTGGEPLYQADFACALAGACRREGIHVCVETCGYGARAQLMRLAEDTDLFLYDIKETDPARHKRFTGVTNRRILQNLRALDEAGKHTILRCPVIPGYNDRAEHFAAIGALAESLHHAQAVHIIPYHPLGRDKSAWLARPYAPGALPFPDKAQTDNWTQAVAAHTKLPVEVA